MQVDCEILAMTDTSALFPLDLSGHRDAPPEEIAPLLGRAVDAADERAIPAVTALLMNRLVRLLRQGSRQEILDESLMLNRLLAVDAGKCLRERRPEAYGGWSVLGELLSGAARSTGRTAVPSLLRGTQGRGLAILELLAAEGRALPRAEVRRRLDFPEAQLSHLLRSLEEANLILRYRRQGSKEVLVELGPTGREVVSESVLPPWVERLRAVANSGLPFDGETLARELQEAGIPSRLMATQIAEIVDQRSLPLRPNVGPSTGDEPRQGKIVHLEEFKKRVARLREGGVSRYEEMQIAEASLSAQRALFGTHQA